MKFLVICFLYCFFSSKITKTSVLGFGTLSLGVLGIYGLIKKQNAQPFIISDNTINILTITPSNETINPTTIQDLIATIALRKTPTMSSISIHNKNFTVEKGVKLERNNGLVFIVSRGYMRASTPGSNDNYIEYGGGLMTAYELIKNNLISNAPCITFDYPDNRKHYSFGQEIDLLCLEYIYKKVLDQNDQAKIVLIGDCRGAKCVLEFLTKKPNNIKAVILFSPFTNVWDLAQQLARNYVSWLPLSDKIIYSFFNLYYPNYFPEKENLLDRLHTLDKDIPILIAHRIHDTVISNQSIFTLINTLEKNGHKHLKVILTEDTSFNHSRMTGIKEVQNGIYAFYQQYNIPWRKSFILSEY